MSPKSEGDEGHAPRPAASGPRTPGDGGGGTPGPGPGPETGAAPDALVAPRLLSRSAEPKPMPPPVHDAEEVTALHLGWARLAGGDEEPTASQGRAGGGSGVRARMRARVASAAKVQASVEHELVGELIRAVDLIARRTDDIAARVQDLELLVQEVVDRVSEDLVRVEVALRDTRDERHPTENP